MAIGTSLAFYYLSRDDNGIPRVRVLVSSVAGRKAHESLLKYTEALRTCYDDIDFLSNALLPPYLKAAAHAEPRKRSEDPIRIPVAQELRDTKDLLTAHNAVRQRLVDLQHVMAVYMLGLNPPGIPLVKSPGSMDFEPHMLLRGLHNGSFTRYSADLGFQCSRETGYTHYADLPAVLTSIDCTVQSFRKHCEDHGNPSP